MNIPSSATKEIEALKVEGKRVKANLLQAKTACQEAEAIEKAVAEYVLANNEYFVENRNGDPDAGKRILTTTMDFLMSDKDFSDYLDRRQKAYKDMYDITIERDRVYSWPFREKYYAVRKEYNRIAVRFLQLLCRPEADTLSKAIDEGYLKPELEEELNRITDEFIGAAQC